MNGMNAAYLVSLWRRWQQERKTLSSWEEVYLACLWAPRGSRLWHWLKAQRRMDQR